jgi:hypothetical protein
MRTKFLVRRPDWKRPLGMSRSRMEDNVEMDPKIGCEFVGYIHMAQDRFL